jgi:hypothetical protein
MKLTTTYRGDELLFEGDLPLTLRALPAGARLTRAQATIAPVERDPQQPFREPLALDAGRGSFGLSAQTIGGATVVDLGARRTVEQLRLGSLTAGTTVTVQVDMGGTWVRIDNQGNLVQNDTPLTPIGNALQLPALGTTRLRLQTNVNAAPDVSSLTLITPPANLSLRIGIGAPFWFRPGDLREPITTPDFAPVLQDALDRIEPEYGIFVVPLLLHSDSLARLRLTLDLEYVIEQSLLPPELSQIVIPYAYGALPMAQATPIVAALPPDAHVLARGTQAQVSGRFDDSRVVFGPVGPTEVKEMIRVAADQSVAHPIRLAQAQTVSAIDLHIEARTITATLGVTLQEDVGGKPFGPSLLAEPIPLKLERPAAGGTVWASARLAEPFNFRADTVYWLIVNSAEGVVDWAVEQAAAEALPVQTTVDNGLSWRAAKSTKLSGPLSGVFRLRAQPARYRQPVQLDIAGRRVLLDAYDGLGKLDFTLAMPEVADALNAALDDAARARATRDERIANGGFDRWTRIDRKRSRLALPAAPLVSPGPHAAAVSPDGARVYVAEVVPGARQPRLRLLVSENRTPLPAPAAVTDLPLPQGTGQVRPLGMALSADGRDLYLTVDVRSGEESRRLEGYWVELADGRAVQIQHGTMELSADRVCHLAVAPGCRRIYGALHRPERSSVLLGLTAPRVRGEQDIDPLVLQDGEELPPRPTARVRLVNAQFDDSWVHVRAGDTMLSLNNRAVSDYESLEPGTYQVELFLGGSSDTPGGLVGGVPLTAVRGEDYSLVVSRHSNDNVPRLTALHDDNRTEPPAGQARARFVNLIEDRDVQQISILLNTAQITPALAYAQVSDYQTFAADTFQLRIFDETGTLIAQTFQDDNPTFVAGSVYTIYCHYDRSECPPTSGPPIVAGAIAQAAMPGIDEPVPLNLLVAPDGRYAYIPMYAGIWAVDLAAWQLLGTAWANPALSTGQDRPPLTNVVTQPPRAWLFLASTRRRIVSAALSCDAARLYAVVEERSEAQTEARRFATLAGVRVAVTSTRVERAVYVLDTALLREVATREAQATTPPDTQVAPFEAAVLARIPLGDVEVGDLWSTCAATPDDTRLLVSAGQVAAAQAASRTSLRRSQEQLFIVDTAASQVLETIDLRFVPRHLLVAPDSRRAFLLGSDLQSQGYYYAAAATPARSRLQAVELDGWTADRWALTAGRVAPTCLPGTAKPAARLGAPGESTGLSQVFKVVGGEEYTLRFKALAMAEGAQADLFWLNATCGLLGTETIPIEPSACAGIQPYSRRATAPAGADRAELRFKQPPGGYTIVDDVSLAAPAAASENGDFGIFVMPPTEPGQPAPTMALPQGWTASPTNVPLDRVLALRVVDGKHQPGVRLSAPTGAPSVLSQVVEVRPGKAFLLAFSAYPTGALSPRGNPAVELRWQGSQAETLRYEIGRQGFDRTLVGGEVPKDATGAELAFVQPPGGALDIVEVQLSQPELVETPLLFLAETPGELTVTAPQVAYDVDPAGAALGAQPGPAEPPEPPLCKPTVPSEAPQAPAGPPGEGETELEPVDEILEGYCPCCEKRHSLEDAKKLQAGGMIGGIGLCPNCQTYVVIWPDRQA